MDEHSSLDSSRLAVDLLMHNTELVGVYRMTCGGTVLVYRGGGFEMFLDSVQLFFLMVSTHLYPPLLIYNKTYTSTILVSFFKYFV